MTSKSFKLLTTLWIYNIIAPMPIRSAVMPQCQPPNNCSVHVFRVRLSQKPESDEQPIENATIVSVVQRKKYGSNYFEIKGGTEMTEKLTKEIMQNMPENADPRLMDKISKNDFYLRPVGPLEEQILTATIPPPPKDFPVYTTSTISSPSSQFPVLLVALLLCIGIVLGILFTGLCLIMADIRKEPKFDRSQAVTYKKVSVSHSEPRRMPLKREEQIELLRRNVEVPVSSTHSQASTSRLAPSWRHGERPSTLGSRQISL